MTRIDRHAEHDWNPTAERPAWCRPAPQRTPRRTTGTRRTLAALAVALVAAGSWLLMHAGVCS